MHNLNILLEVLTCSTNPENSSEPEGTRKGDVLEQLNLFDVL